MIPNTAKPWLALHDEVYTDDGCFVCATDGDVELAKHIAAVHNISLEQSDDA